MGTATVVTVDDISSLESDVDELNTKLNGVITQYNLVQADMTTNKDAIDEIKSEHNKIKSDMLISVPLINDLKADVGALRTQINGSYTGGGTSGGGSSDDSILERLKILHNDVAELDSILEAHRKAEGGDTGAGGAHPGPQGLSGGASGSGQGEIGDGMVDLDQSAALTATTTAVDTSVALELNTNDDSAAATPSVVGGVYSTSEQNVLTIGTKGEKRARRLARKTLNRLRK